MSPSTTSTTVTHVDSPNPKACLGCRSKHLKCDGKTPICSRCVSSRTTCQYVQSRRGQRSGSKRTPFVDTSNASHLIQSSFLDRGHASNPISQDRGLSPAAFMLATSPEASTVSMARPDNATHDPLIELFYRNIYPAHPFVLPRSVYLDNPQVFPTHLQHAMRFIARHYARTSEPEEATFIFDPTIIEDGFKVQALLLVTLASYARFERELGNRALTSAIELALRIGLNSNEFALDQSAVLQESWRRTWWELYGISGLISLISGVEVSLFFPDEMALPTNCEEYGRGQVTQVRSTAEMQQRFSAEDGFLWSSFAYRVEAMRILRSVISMPSDAPTARCHAANAAISSFLLSIPSEKRDGLKDDGETDEVMSCSLMIIHLASICHHFPRSGLADFRCSTTVCGTARPTFSDEETRLHRAASLRSATALSSLIVSRPSLKSLSPCFSCAIAFAAVVQLSECLQQNSAESESLKEHIKHELAALNEIGTIWPIARVVRGQIAQFARELVDNKPFQESSDMAMAEMPNMGDQDQWMQDLLTEDFDFPASAFSMPGLG